MDLLYFFLSGKKLRVTREKYDGLPDMFTEVVDGFRVLE